MTRRLLAIAALLAGAAGCVMTPLPPPLARSTRIVPTGRIQVTATGGYEQAATAAPGDGGVPMVLALRTGLTDHLDGTVRLWLEGASLDLGWQPLRYGRTQLTLAPSLSISNGTPRNALCADCTYPGVTPVVALELPVLLGIGTEESRLVVAPRLVAAYAFGNVAGMPAGGGPIDPAGVRVLAGVSVAWDVEIAGAVHLLPEAAAGWVADGNTGWFSMSLGLSVP